MTERFPIFAYVFLMICFYFKKGNPHHPSTYRLPPLHQLLWIPTVGIGVGHVASGNVGCPFWNFGIQLLFAEFWVCSIQEYLKGLLDSLTGLIGWLVDYLFNGSIDRLIGWPIDRLID